MEKRETIQYRLLPTAKKLNVEAERAKKIFICVF